MRLTSRLAMSSAWPGSVSNPIADLFALGEPGVWFDPSDVANLNWRRNLLTWTEQFDNAVWSKGTGGTIVANSVADPNGNLTADAYTWATSTTSYAYLSQTISSTSTLAHTFSIWLKMPAGSGSRKVRLAITDATVSTVDSTDFIVTESWQRFSFTRASPNSTGQVGVGLFLAGSPSIAAGEILHVWGAQLEVGSAATEYQRITNVNAEILEQFPKTTMFQDRAGTTPVTAPGQSVGLRLDKSKGLVLGPELVTNGDFSADANWVKGSGWTISGGTANTVQPNNLQNIAQVRAFPVATYRVQFTISNYVAGALTARFSGGGADSAPSVSANGTYTFLVTTTGPRTQFDILAAGGSGATASIDNISVKELPGNHAVANSDAARGVYGIEPLGGRRNLLTFTEQFDNAAWTKIDVTVTANAAVAPDGTTTADLLGSSANFARLRRTGVNLVAGVTYTLSCWYLNVNVAENDPVSMRQVVYDDVAKAEVISNYIADDLVSAGSSWVRLFTTFTAVSNGAHWFEPIRDLNSGKSVYAWGAQLETGSTATPYQRVVSQYEVTEAGKPTLHYVSYDGVDDGYVTPTITPGTDKVQVFAGVRKLSDAAIGVVAETGAGVLQSVRLFAPRAAAQNYAFGSSGSVLAEATGTGFAAPISNVITGLGDISGDNATLRVNGVQVAQATADQGTGNYGNLPLYIGRRGGTTLPFNGRDYGIIVRFGSNLDASTISKMERLLARKTGVTL